MNLLKTIKLYELVTTNGRKINLKKGEVFQSSDQELQFSVVQRGYVKRYMIRKDGSLGVQSIYGPGYFFPLTVVYKILLNQSTYSGPEVLHYAAMTDASVYAIDSQKLKTAVQNDPSLYTDLFYVSGRRIQSNIQRIENSSLQVYYNQVAHQLLFFGEIYGKKRGRETIIDLPLTQQDIADVLSTTRETASLSLRALRQKGLIKAGSGKHIIIPSMRRLSKEAYS